MHNCRETVEQVTELLLDGADRVPNDALSAELRRCAECRSEFDALSATLRITTRLTETSIPSESYWTSYHAKLRQKLTSANSLPLQTAQPSWFVRFIRSSVPVPVPLAVAAMIVVAILLSLALRTVPPPGAPTPSVVRVPVEVPVVQEKVVTRMVYRDRRSLARNTKRAINTETAFAQSRKQRVEEVPAGLVGFKPTDEIKLTVIKGAVPNEK